MALFCSRDLFAALNGVDFPATKDILLNYAERRDAQEAVVVMLNGLEDGASFSDIGEVCENARVACNIEVRRSLSDAAFPATRESLLAHARSHGASSAALQSLEALPRSYTFASLDETCEHIL